MVGINLPNKVCALGESRHTDPRPSRLIRYIIGEKCGVFPGGVCKATVSKVLNKRPGVSEETRRSVIRVCEELGYRLNPSIQDFVRKMVSGVTMNLAFVLVGVDFADPAYAPFIDGVARATEEGNYRLVFIKLSGEEESIFDLSPVLRDHRVDGVLISGKVDTSVLALINELDIPFIILGNYSNSISRDSVAVEIDVDLGVHKAIEQLKLLGKTRIACFSEGPGQLFLESVLQCFSGSTR